MLVIILKTVGNGFPNQFKFLLNRVNIIGTYIEPSAIFGNIIVMCIDNDIHILRYTVIYNFLDTAHPHFLDRTILIDHISPGYGNTHCIISGIVKRLHIFLCRHLPLPCCLTRSKAGMTIHCISKIRSNSHL